MLDSGTSNPYLSPPLLDEVRSRSKGLGPSYAVQLTAKSWAYRRLCISGACHAVIEYDGYWPLDTVAVNGVVVSRKTGWQGYAPRHDFSIPNEGEVLPARIDIKLSWGMVFKTFRLSIGPDLVYAEEY